MPSAATTPDRYLPLDTDDEARPLPDDLNDDVLADMLQGMLTIRAFDERAVAMQRQGRLGNYPSCWGEEATQVGPLHALDDDDWLFPSYRQQSLPILRGVDPATILNYRRGVGGTQGFWSPRQHRCAPITISIATQLPHAVGFAWAAKISKDPVCCIVWFGDGATSEGDFHEAMNFAAVFKTATVFFCTNNQWAISTPYERQTASTTIAEKAAAYGMPGERVDGFDVVACWDATRRALERARTGEGPTLIEAVTFRIGPHATADDPGRYRDQSDVEKVWRPREPIERLARYLRASGALTSGREQEMLTEAKSIVERAVRDMEAIPLPGPDVLFETTYSGAQPWTLEEGRAEAAYDESPSGG
jgi:TPP-dependent pyruvate/acetoin dehydrogenase alpha subunit